MPPASFVSKLRAEAVSDSEWKLLEPLIYISGVLGRISARVGFITDFASVPRVPFIFDVLGDIAHRSAVIHDWLYYCGATSRLTADRVLFEAMKLDDIPLWKRSQIFLGVRIGGWKPWGDHRKAGHKAPIA